MTPTTKGVLTVVSTEGSTSEQPPGKRPRSNTQPIVFDDDDLEVTTQPHHDALIVTAQIRGFIVKRIMIDQGSGADVMYLDLYRGLGLKKEDLSKYDSPLMGFDGHMVISEGQISLPVIMGGRKVLVTFIVVTSFSPYTAILERPWIHDMEAVPSTLHVKIKFRTEEGITVIRGDQHAARQCLVTVAIEQTKQREPVENPPQQQLQDPKGEGTSSAEDLVSIKILLGSERSFQIGAGLSNGERVQLLLFLIQNVDVFAWSPYEVPGVDPEFIVHKLNVDPSFPPKKQRPRRSAREHADAIRQEVGRLREAGAIKETFFPEWLSNTVVVKKKGGKWKVCVNFTDLNRACPKDLFPMPKIDQLVDATYGHLRMSFLDAFQGYHQIALAIED
ncbi:uncharacterized protein LOC142628442 [Castanea sativa]|uniref:uncharacterized protein LOC142628442 n=1 Tax=Castanea sativa TaxID=21020 RepID=UPI003F649BF2